MCVLCPAGRAKRPATGSSDTPWASAAPVDGAISRTIAPTGASEVDALLSGQAWFSKHLSYGFPTMPEAYGYGGEPGDGFAPVTLAQQAAIVTGLAMFAAVADVTFAPAGPSGALLRFARSDTPPTAFAYYPDDSEKGGDVWINRSSDDYADPVAGNYGFHTILHEIGHALGLKHAHERDGPFPELGGAWNGMAYTVMTYASYPGANIERGYVNEAASYAQSLMLLDIAALQAVYGANYGHNPGNTTYRWDPATARLSVDGVDQGPTAGNRILMTVWDGGGRDTYDLSAYATGVAVDLTPGAWSTFSSLQLADLDGARGGRVAAGNVANAWLYADDPRSLIENAVGGRAADRLTGNSAANVLSGRDGDDTLEGGTGDDTLVGGSGRDRLFGGSGFDVASYETSAAGVTASLAGPRRGGEARGDRYDGIEGLLGSTYADSFHGSASADALGGNAGDDWLTGKGGNDTLDGGDGADVLTGGLGADRLAGGAGADVFAFDFWRECGVGASRDVIVDFSPGTDRIRVSRLDADGTRTGNQSFAFIGTTGDTTIGAGRISTKAVTVDGIAMTIVALERDGDAEPEGEIALLGAIALSAADFLL